MVDFTNIEQDLLLHGVKLKQNLNFQVANAKEVMQASLRHFLGDFTWIPEYDKVAAWLSNNNGRGILLSGTNGVGKTVICQRVIPAIFLRCFGKVVSCYDYSELNRCADEVLGKSIISLDDIGNEEMGNSYGNKRWVFPEIMDLAEKRGNLVIISTNLKGDDILSKYGVRTYERLIATTVRVVLNHKSFRK